jgi:ribosomal protein S18 acetylase RimI-like enzyme
VTTDFEIVRAGAERLLSVEPLYRALDEHHGRLLPNAGPLTKRPHAESWAQRRGSYEEWLGDGAILLLAVPRDEPDGPPIGYAMISVGDESDGWEGAIGQVESLSVAAEWRGRGVGGALLDAAERALAAAGIPAILISVIEPNERARQLYEDRGMTPFIRTLIGPVRG